MYQYKVLHYPNVAKKQVAYTCLIIKTSKKNSHIMNLNSCLLVSLIANVMMRYFLSKNFLFTSK